MRVKGFGFTVLLCGFANWTPLVSAQETGQVDGARIANANTEPEQWLSYGRTYDEQRFSPLDQINTDNIDALGLAWTYDTGQRRGHEATPIVVDGPGPKSECRTSS